MLVVSWPFCGVATTCGVALIGGEATAQPARPTSISNTMRRAIVRPSALSKDSTHTLTAGVSLQYTTKFRWMGYQSDRRFPTLARGRLPRIEPGPGCLTAGLEST